MQLVKLFSKTYQSLTRKTSEQDQSCRDKEICPESYVPFFWINLDRYTSRANRMISLFNEKNISNHRISALDAEFEEVERYCDLDWIPGQTQRKELAAALSHIKAVLAFVRDTKSNCAVICEDDVSFEWEKQWPRSIYDVLHEAPAGWDILQLGLTVTEQETFETLKKQERGCVSYMRKNPRYFGAFAYAISRSCATRWLKSYKVRELDGRFHCVYRAPRYKHQADKHLFMECKSIYTVLPPLFTYPSINDSSIHPEQLDTHARSKNMIFNLFYA